MRRAVHRLESLQYRSSAARAAADVIAHVEHALGPRRRGQQRIERRHAPGVGRGHVEPRADVVERAFADPADARLHGLQRGEQLVPAGAGRVSAERHVCIALRHALAAVPPGRGRTKSCVDRLAFLVGRSDVEQFQVHQSPNTGSEWRWSARAGASSGARTGSTRTAHALNSAVPERGSVASIVSRLTRTWSWKWNVMKTRPARSDVSMCAGATMLPRREVMRTRSPSPMSRRRASSGAMSSVSPRLSGDVYPAVCTPVLYESRRRPVVSVNGYSSSGSSTGGSYSVSENAALGNPTGSAHNRACRNCAPGSCSFGHGHWMPSNSSSRRYVIPPNMSGAISRTSSHTCSALGVPQSWPNRRATCEMIHSSSRASPGGSSALR